MSASSEAVAGCDPILNHPPDLPQPEIRAPFPFASPPPIPLLSILSFCQKTTSSPLAFSKPVHILIPLEVYMVNSPSRPNLRPPAPVECGGMTPLWNWETCLPVDRAPLPKACPRAGRGRPRHRFPAPRPEIREPRPDFPLPSRQNQGSIKAKTPTIKAHQAISRQTRKFPWHPAFRLGIPHLCPSAFICGQNSLSRPSRPSRPSRFPAPVPARNPRPGFLCHQGSIKAKTPAIKAYQAISRQTRKFPMAPGIPPRNSPICVHPHLSAVKVPCRIPPLRLCVFASLR